MMMKMMVVALMRVIYLHVMPQKQAEKSPIRHTCARRAQSEHWCWSKSAENDAGVLVDFTKYIAFLLCLRDVRVCTLLPG